jgi:hypothetical protein
MLSAITPKLVSESSMTSNLRSEGIQYARCQYVQAALTFFDSAICISTAQGNKNANRLTELKTRRMGDRQVLWRAQRAKRRTIVSFVPQLLGQARRFFGQQFHKIRAFFPQIIMNIVIITPRISASAFIPDCE